jgi:hypothetical protein
MLWMELKPKYWPALMSYNRGTMIGFSQTDQFVTHGADSIAVILIHGKLTTAGENRM